MYVSAWQDFFLQVVEDGYEFFAKRQLVTLFSAPNYCGEFDNAGAMMSVDETLMCSFQILKVRQIRRMDRLTPRINSYLSEINVYLSYFWNSVAHAGIVFQIFRQLSVTMKF